MQKSAFFGIILGAILIVGIWPSAFPVNAVPVITSTTKADNLVPSPNPVINVFDPSKVPNYFGQDLGPVSWNTSPNGFSWNTTTGDSLMMQLPKIGTTIPTNTLVYSNSSHTALKLAALGHTINLFFKTSKYQTKISIEANLLSPQTVCLPFSSPNPIVQQTAINKTTFKAYNLPSIRAGNEIFDWKDIPVLYSPVWNGSLCLSLPSGITNIDPLALNGSGSNTWTGGASQTCTLTTTTTNDIIMTMVVGHPTLPLTSGQITIADTSLLTWTLRAYLVDGTTGDQIEWWYAKSSGILSADVITLTITRLSTAMNNGLVTCFGVSGADQTTIFDGNAAIPKTGSSSSGGHPSLVISTNNANDFLVGSTVIEGGAGADPPTGWTNIVETACNAYSCDTSYKIVSATQSSVTITWNGDSDNWVAGIDAIMQATATVTQPIKITTLTAGAPSGTITISGCGASNGTFTANGNVKHYSGMTASCTVTLSDPATCQGTPPTTYCFNKSPHPTATNSITFQTCASGTCSEYDNITYYQLQQFKHVVLAVYDGFKVTPTNPGNWDGNYTVDIFGTYLGVPNTDVCFADERFQHTLEGTPNTALSANLVCDDDWADYNLPVTIEGLSGGNSIGNTWFPSPTGSNVFTQTTAPNNDNTNYVQAQAGAAPNFLWLLVIPFIPIFAFVAVKKRR